MKLGYKEPSQRPTNFDQKMKNFTDLANLRSVWPIKNFIIIEEIK